MTAPKILVTDGRSLSCLAFVRELGRGGMEVHVGESFGRNIAAYSKFASESHVYPSAQSETDDFKAELLELARQELYDFVIPTRDATTIALAEIRDQLPDGTETLLDAPEKIERLNDKERCAHLAERVGIPIPDTYYPSEMPIEDIRTKARFPVLVKPTHGAGSRGIQRVETPGELAAAHRSVTRDRGRAIVQEYVDHSGGHYSIGTVFDRDSEPRALHVYRELEQYPDSGGPAIRAVSVDPGPWVDEMLELLREIRWVGPAHMDVLLDPRDDTYKLLEVNPRIWMSVALTIRSGVDVPRVLIDIAKRTAPSESSSYETDVAYRWVLPNEILWALDGRDTPNRVLRLLRTGRSPTCYGILSREDPHAVVGALAQSLGFVLDSERRQIVFGRGW